MIINFNYFIVVIQIFFGFLIDSMSILIKWTDDLALYVFIAARGLKRINVLDKARM